MTQAITGVQVSRAQRIQQETNKLAQATASAELTFATDKANAQRDNELGGLNLSLPRENTTIEADRIQILAIQNVTDQFNIDVAVNKGTYSLNQFTDHTDAMVARHQNINSTLSYFQAENARIDQEWARAAAWAGEQYATILAQTNADWAVASQNAAVTAARALVASADVDARNRVQSKHENVVTVAQASAELYLATKSAQAELIVVRAEQQGITDVAYAKAIRDRDNEYATAGVAWVKAVSQAQRDLTIEAITQEEFQEQVKKARDARTAAKEAADKKFEAAVDQASEQPNQEIGQARIRYVEQVYSARVKFTSEIKQADYDYLDSTTESRLERAEKDVRASNLNQSKQAQAHFALERTLANLQVTLAEQTRNDDIGRQRAKAFNEVVYHISEAQRKADFWYQAASNNPFDQLTWFNALESAAVRNWTQDLGDFYVDYRGELARLDGQYAVDIQSVKGTRKLDRYAAELDYFVRLEGVKNGYQLARDQNAAVAEIARSSASQELWNQIANAEKIYAVDLVHADVKYDADIDAINRKHRRDENQDAAAEKRKVARYTFDVSNADAALKWRGLVSTAERTYSTQEAAITRDLTIIQAQAFAHFERQVAIRDRARANAYTNADVNFWRDELQATHIRDYAQANAVTLFVSGQKAARVTATNDLTAISSQLADFVPWSIHQKEKAASEAAAWNQTRFLYLQSVTAMANADIAVNHTYTQRYRYATNALASAKRDYRVSLTNLQLDNTIAGARLQGDFELGIADLVYDYRSDLAGAQHRRDLGNAEATRDGVSNAGVTQQFNSEKDAAEQGYRDGFNRVYNQRAARGAQLGRTLVEQTARLNRQLATRTAQQKNRLNDAVADANFEGQIIKAQIQRNYSIAVSMNELTQLNQLAQNTPSPWADLDAATSEARNTAIEAMADAGLNTNLKIIRGDQRHQRVNNQVVAQREVWGITVEADLSEVESAILATQLGYGQNGEIVLPKDFALPDVDLGEVSLISDSYYRFQPGSISDAWYSFYYGGYWSSGSYFWNWGGGIWSGFGRFYNSWSLGYGGYGYGGYYGGGYFNGYGGYLNGYGGLGYDGIGYGAWGYGGYGWGGHYGWGHTYGWYGYWGYRNYSPWVFGWGGWTSNYVSAPTLSPTGSDIDVQGAIDEFNATLDAAYEEAAKASVIALPEDTSEILAWSENNPAISIPGANANVEFHTAETPELNPDGTIKLPVLTGEVDAQVTHYVEARAFATKNLKRVDEFFLSFGQATQNTLNSLDDTNSIVLAGLDFYVGYLEGILKGFFVDGALGTLKFAGSILKFVYWNSPVGVLNDYAYNFYKGEGNYKHVRQAKTAQKIAGAVTDYGPWLFALKHDFDRLQAILGGQALSNVADDFRDGSIVGKVLTQGVAGALVSNVAETITNRQDLENVLAEWYRGMSEKTKTVMEVVGKVMDTVNEELKKIDFTNHAEDIGHIYGRVVGMILFEVAFAFGTAGIGTAAKVGAGYGAKIVNKLRSFKSLRGVAWGRVGTALDNAFAFLNNVARLPICFVAGTKVHTDGGLRNIEEIRPGDRVLTRFETGDAASSNQYSKVLQTFTTTPDTLYHVAITDESGHEDRLVCTGEHPFYELRKCEFVPAKNLQDGDKVSFADGSVGLVIRVKEESQMEPVTTYNFEVESTHTYFVGEKGVWVHNSGDDCLRAAKLIVEELGTKLDNINASNLDDIAEVIAKHISSIEKVENPGIRLMQKHFDDVLKRLEDGITTASGVTKKLNQAQIDELRKLRPLDAAQLKKAVRLETQAKIAEAAYNAPPGVALSQSSYGPFTSKFRVNINVKAKNVGKTLEGGVEGAKRVGDEVHIEKVPDYIARVAKEYDKLGLKLQEEVKRAIIKYIDDVSGVIQNGDGLPGMHAEVIAVNEVIQKMRKANIAPTEKMIKSIKVATRKLKNKTGQGQPFKACANCTGILEKMKVRVLTGVTQ